MIRKENQEFQFFVQFVQQATTKLREYRQPEFKIGHRVRYSKYDLPIRKGYKPLFTCKHGKMLKCSNFFRKNLQHTQWKMNMMRLSVVKDIKKKWWKSFNNGIAYKSVSFQWIFTTTSGRYTQLFYKLLTGATEPKRSMGGCNFGIFLPISVPKWHRGKFHSRE